MGKAQRKPRPSLPGWEWIDRDGCWFCRTPNNCNQCKANREFLKEYYDKKQKGRHVGKKTTRRAYGDYDEEY